MSIFIYVLLGSLAVGIFLMLTHNNKFSYIFLFMLFSIININVNYIRFEKFQLTTYPKELENYYALIIDRSVIVPMLILYAVYTFSRATTIMRKVSLLIIWVVVLGCYDYIGTILGVNIYFKWTTFYSMVLYVLYIILALLMKKWFERRFRIGGIR